MKAFLFIASASALTVETAPRDASLKLAQGALGQNCTAFTDCASKTCANGQCAAAPAHDAVPLDLCAMDDSSGQFVHTNLQLATAFKKLPSGNKQRGDYIVTMVKAVAQDPALIEKVRPALCKDNGATNNIQAACKATKDLTGEPLVAALKTILDKGKTNPEDAEVVNLTKALDDHIMSMLPVALGLLRKTECLELSLTALWGKASFTKDPACKVHVNNLSPKDKWAALAIDTILLKNGEHGLVPLCKIQGKDVSLNQVCDKANLSQQCTDLAAKGSGTLSARLDLAANLGFGMKEGLEFFVFVSAIGYAFPQSQPFIDQLLKKVFDALLALSIENAISTAAKNGNVGK